MYALIRCAVVVGLVLQVSLGFAYSDIPSSARSRAAIEKVMPKLRQEMEAKHLTCGAPIYIRIFKQEKQLEVWVKSSTRFTLFKTYDVCTYGSEGLGPKVREGDGRAPEGFYYVTPAQMNPVSNYHLAFNLGYPNRYDRLHGRTGSALMVHGDCVSIGCYAMTDNSIEELFALADAAFRNGQPFFRIHVFPFRMTQENMHAHQTSVWYDFWTNLKEGCDFFEAHTIPPNVEVRNRRYLFSMP